MSTVEAGRMAPAGRTTSVSRLRMIQQGGGVVLLAVVGLVWVAPFLWGIVTSFKSEADAAALPVRVVPEGGSTLSAYQAVFEAGDLVRWLANSLFTATVITVVTLVISAMAGYALSRGLFRGRRLLMAATLASIMVPGQILIVPLFQEMLLLNMIDTLDAVGVLHRRQAHRHRHQAGVVHGDEGPQEVVPGADEHEDRDRRQHRPPTCWRWCASSA